MIQSNYFQEATYNIKQVGASFASSMENFTLHEETVFHTHGKVYKESLFEVR